MKRRERGRSTEKRLGEHFGQRAAEAMSAAGVEIHERDDRRAKEMRIDLIKIVAVAGEDAGERFAVVGRGAARYARAERRRDWHRRRAPRG